METKNRELTRAELEVMQILWEKNGAFVNEIVDVMPSPKPAYNTISTIVRILEKKEFVDHESFGRTFRYFPLISKQEYTTNYMSGVLTNFFDGSLTQMVSFFAQKENISTKELDEIMEILNRKE